WVPAIAETRRIYRPELIGCGESDVPAAGYEFTPEAIADQIIATLDALSLARVHWVGESSGGIVGVLLAAAHPERIASLVLCNTPGRMTSRAVVDEIGGSLDLRRLFAPPQADWWARLPRPASIEELVHYWQGQVDPSYDP